MAPKSRARGGEHGGVTVVGSLNQDHVVLVDQLPPEGATVAGHGYVTGAGGKGLNQAVAAARQGAEVTMVGAVGDDAAGRSLLALLADEGIDATGVRTVGGHPTGVALITVADGGTNTIVVVAGANAQVTPPADRHGPGGAPAVVLTQLEIPLPAVQAALAGARAAGAIGILNPAPAAGPLPADLVALASLIVPNETEAAALTGEADPEAAARALLACGCGAVIVTLGERGALLVDSSGATRIPAYPVTAVDSTAAGDAFCGTLAASLAAGASLAEAAKRASAAGALAATARGAVNSLPSRAAVINMAGLS